MNIASVEPIAVGLPMKKPVIMAGEEVRRADNVLVRVVAADGTVGWGEAASAPTMTGETIESMTAAIRHLAPVLDGRDPADIDGALAAMDARMYGNHGAKAALEIALHDLVGRATGRPVHALLGERRRDRAALLGVVGGGDRAGDLADAARKATDGYTAFKIKVGVDTPERDAERTRAICALLDGEALVSADANQGFSVEQALTFVRAVADAGLDFVEQPVVAHDLAGMAEIAAATPIALGADEGIHGIDDIRRHHERRAAHGVSLKAIKLGGLRAVVEAGRLADRLGMGVNLSCKTGESSIACAAALHAAAVLPGLAWGLTLTCQALGSDVTAHPVAIARGHAEVMDRPGLGIEVDEAMIQRHRIAVPLRSVA
ncbi:enolase C-terminal domain-like protein [Rhodoplanes sp. TEM]|uniref:Enolase C-terminal domain-like protein n=1 Tax=Rhodoplanes tepidamans TaxID=200616 RepID=A0ABT5JG15_RHOTP|nr:MULTISPECIES: enolase C-terminal domain-like protein [Rhodoplanes]MDC7788517.1 enolase C-terminal domain-like protein [Rhodoplanes tepidamans]MDC7985116.1 enolase C-terminal domain-like protein [Rhodoplanes sp. TEM]MDQ0353424.1 muconate cycloisomerase [Rhodoplanes tepidamans]